MHSYILVQLSLLIAAAVQEENCLSAHTTYLLYVATLFWCDLAATDLL